MIEKERLIKAPTITAEEIRDDDYILIDSPTLGVRKYLASKLLPEPIEYLYKWDFTKETDPLVDEVQGAIVSLYSGDSKNPVRVLPNVGVQIYKHNQFIDIPINGINGKTIEVDMGEMDFKQFNNSHGRFLMYNSEEGFIFRLPSSEPNQWKVYLNGHWTSNNVTFSDKTNANIFKNSTIKMVIDNNKTYYYKNDELIYADNENIGNKTTINIGSTGYTFYDMVIKAIRIYETIEEV